MDKRINIKNLQKEKNRPLILDGAIGSLLTLEMQPHIHLWSSHANIVSPDLVKNIYKSYINSGADIITTNTFRTNPTAIKSANLDLSVKDFVNQSVNLAIEARDENENIIIAGSNAPAEDCYQAERTISKSALEYNHKKHIELLWESGCDIILNETLSHFDEIKIIAEFCNTNKIEFIISLFINDNQKLLSGEPIQEAIELIRDCNPSAISFNCIHPKTFHEFMEKHSPDYDWGFYLNCGAGEYTDINIQCGISASDYLQQIKKYIDDKILFVGSCCGSTPEHTKKIKEYFDEIY